MKKPITLQKWLEEHNMSLNVKLNGDSIYLKKDSRPESEHDNIDKEPWWRAFFSHGCETAIIATHTIIGEGHTPNQAIDNLIKQIPNQQFVVIWPSRTETFNIPEDIDISSIEED